MKYEFVWLIDHIRIVCGNSHFLIRSINNSALFGLLHQHHLPKVLAFLFGGWSEEVRWNTNSYDWLTTYEFVCGNLHGSIHSINDGALFGGRREETQEDANKIRIRMIIFPHTNLYVVTHMYQFVALLFYSTLFCCGGKANLVRFTLFYSTLLALTHRQTDGQTEERKHSLRVGWRNLPTLCVGWRNLFSSCAVVSVFGSGGK